MGRVSREQVQYLRQVQRRRTLTPQEDEILRRASLEAWGRQGAPRVVAPGTPDFDVKLLHDKPRPVRTLTEADIKCDAGSVAQAGRGVRCSIEDHVLTLDGEPSSLMRYCLSEEGCIGCPSWREEKRREKAGEPSLVVRG